MIQAVIGAPKKQNFDVGFVDRSIKDGIFGTFLYVCVGEFGE